VLDEGPYGVLYQAMHTVTQKTLMIKLIIKPFENEHKAREVYREMKILNRLSEFENNVFTSTIYDIILPDEAIKTKVKSSSTSL